VKSVLVNASLRVVSNDEVMLNVPREILMGYERGDVVTLDCARAKGNFEVLAVDLDAQTLTARPHARVTSSARPNRHDRRAIAKLKLVPAP
jgi:hypothetical protein